MPTADALFIAGEWSAPSQWADVVSPSTQEVIGRAPFATTQDIDVAVEAARSVADQASWASLPMAERADALDRVLTALEPVLPDVARLVTAEMGLPIAVSQAQNNETVRLLWRYTTALARRFAVEEVRDATPDVLLLRQPVGVVAAIVPWNAPFMQAVYKVLYPLVAGCPVILKPAPETPLDCYALADAMVAAGIPKGVFSIVSGGPDIGDHLMRHPGVNKVSFTGSTAVGRHIGAICGDQMKRTLLELGGKSAAVVFDDADIDAAMSGLAAGAFANTGQVCTATSRLLVARSVHNEVVERLQHIAETSIVGDPFDAATQLGPLVAERQRARVEHYVRLGKSEGGRLVTGGGRPKDLPRGWYFEPTIFDRIDNRARIAQEEIFGPVITVTAFDNDREAIELANDSQYGLHGAVYTSDPDRARAVVTGVRTGAMSVNGFFSNFRAPFGGVKLSGIGRKFGDEGLASFFEMKTVHNPGLLLGQ